jgi:sugar O-acyltransferase (sialic acid O-acetyltransferase NeuD family)
MGVQAKFALGRINANEDEAKLVEIAIKDGERFSKGDHILTFETSKVAIEVLAPSDGKMISFKAPVGAILAIGSVVFEAEFEGDMSFDMLECTDDEVQTIAAAKTNAPGRKVSYKAEMLAKRLGIDLTLIPSVGITVKESDVRAYAERQGESAAAEVPADQANTLIAMSKVPASALRAIIFGAGGHAKSILQMIREAGYLVAGVVAPQRPNGSTFFETYPVLGTHHDLESIRASGVAVAFVGVGGATGNDARAKIYNQLKDAGFIMPPLVSKMASFDPTTRLGQATYVFPGATVGADCVIGSDVIVNQGSIVCHDCRVGDHVHLAPGSILAGKVTVGAGSTIGMSAALMNNVSIGSNVLVHNTVAVARDIPPGKIVTLKGILDHTEVG